MGYYASYSGTITFKEHPDEEIIKLVRQTFSEVYENRDGVTFEVCGDEKYYSDEIEEALTELEPLLSDLYIAYQGEDECFWRFTLKNGKWFEESGEVIFDSDYPVNSENADDFISQIIDIMQDECIDNRRGYIIEGEWYDRISDSLELLMKNWNIIR